MAVPMVVRRADGRVDQKAGPTAGAMAAPMAEQKVGPTADAMAARKAVQ
jgi:hypothetical protein